MPCRKDCPDRSPTCHATCGKYKAFTEKLAAERASRCKENDLIHGQIENRRRFWGNYWKG